MRFKESPEPPQPGCAPVSGDKVMHTSLRIGATTLMASDGQCSGTTNFEGFSLSLSVATESEADKYFRRPGRRRKGLYAVGQDVLVASVWHGGRQVWRLLDDHDRAS
jgi:predicted 3-demethylubiquinone-9 3-methyltransferase (glyoxalase superfamily)